MIHDHLTSLAACLCAQISLDGLPETCFCGIIPGEGPAFEYAGDCAKKCGMAWVRLANIYPASGIGIINEDVKNCGHGLGYEVDVGIVRCTPVGTADKPPSSFELNAAATLQIADAYTMRKAIACCDGSNDWILGAYSNLGPVGGMLGGFWGLTMWEP